MDQLFPTFFSKTFFILGIQLFITWVAACATLAMFRRKYLEKVDWITATKNEAGEPDLHIDNSHIRGWVIALIVAFIVTFLILFFWASKSLSLGLTVFSVWSIITGAMVALTLLSVDENLGSKVLGITATIVFGTALIGIFSGIDFGFLNGALFLALTALVLFNIIRLFVAIPRPMQRFVAGVGVIIFTLYLVYDFNRVSKLHAMGVNEWESAIRISISIYLDVINLFLELLDLMSN